MKQTLSIYKITKKIYPIGDNVDHQRVEETYIDGDDEDGNDDDDDKTTRDV